MHWQGIAYHARFEAGGGYRADHEHGGANYIGSWRLDGRTLYLTESCRPECPESWRHYRIELDERLRAGTIDQGGRVELEVR